MRTDQRRPQSPGAALVLGLVKSMAPALEDLKSMNAL